MFHQPANGPIVGQEVLDPDPHLCVSWSTWRCRWADATLVAVDDGAAIWPGTIGRPRERKREVTCSDGRCSDAVLAVDPDSPRLRIMGVLRSVMRGEELHKVGRTSGWTHGTVTNPDKAALWSDEQFSIKHNTEVNYVSHSGDSGSPVFSLRDDDTLTVNLHGIHWGRWPGGGAAVSPLKRIEQDFGRRLLVTNLPWPDLSASIDGPKRVVGPVECTWTAIVEEGEDPYWGQGDPDGDPWWWPWSYAWSGILSGDGEELTGTASRGRLRLEVTDKRGVSATDSMFVQVIPSDPSNFGGGQPVPGCYDEYDPDYF